MAIGDLASQALRAKRGSNAGTIPKCDALTH
jgi:hypothetical protein